MGFLDFYKMSEPSIADPTVMVHNYTYVSFLLPVLNWRRKQQTI